MADDLDVTMELPRPDSAMTVAVDADGQPIVLSDRDDLTEPGVDVANLNDFNGEETPSCEKLSEVPANGEVVPPETMVPESDAPTPQIVTSFTLANLDEVEADASAIKLLVSSQGQIGENVVAVADSSVVEAETVVVAEASETTQPVAADQNALPSTSKLFTSF